MRTVYDLRLYEDAARKVLPDGLGRVGRLLRDHRVKGARIEVAHLR